MYIIKSSANAVANVVVVGTILFSPESVTKVKPPIRNFIVIVKVFNVE